MNAFFDKKGTEVPGVIIVVAICIIIAAFVLFMLWYKSGPSRIIPPSNDVICGKFWLDNDNHLNVLYRDNSNGTNWVYISVMDENNAVQWSENHISSSFTTVWGGLVPSAFYSIELRISHADYGTTTWAGFYYGLSFAGHIGIILPPSLNGGQGFSSVDQMWEVNHALPSLAYNAFGTVKTYQGYNYVWAGTNWVTQDYWNQQMKVK